MTPQRKSDDDMNTPVEAKFAGVCDSRLSTLSEVDSNHDKSIAPLAAATAQMFYLGSGCKIDNSKNLHLTSRYLRDVSIGGHRLCTYTKSDFGRFLSQPCAVAGWTAVLVGPRHVLTAAHAIDVSKARGHYLVFGRTTNAPHVEFNGSEIIVKQGDYYQVNSLLAYVNSGNTDWALLELVSTPDIRPLDVRPWKPGVNGITLGHPLGLPMKTSDFKPDSQRPAVLPYQISVDNASAGSGTPVFQEGHVVGVIRGDADIDKECLVRHGNLLCLDPAFRTCDVLQPFTPSQKFAQTLPEIFG